MPVATKWTESDIQLLREYHHRGLKGLPPQLLANYSAYAIYKKAHKLGFTVNGRKPMGARIGDAMKQLPQTDLAYMAGIYDGEGWVSAQVRKNGNIYLECGIGSTDRVMLDFFHLRVPHSTILTNKIYPNRKPSWTFKVRGQLCVYDFLDALLPYLITKRARSIEAMSQIRSRWSHLFDS